MVKKSIIILWCVILSQCAHLVKDKEIEDVKGNAFLEGMYLWEQFKSNGVER